MARAICIACGEEKTVPWRKCRRCGFNPEGDEDSLIKSVYLSTGRFDEEGDKERYEGELDELGRRIRAGKAVEFNQNELRRLRQQRKMIESVPMTAVLWALFRFFLPAIILIVAIFGLGVMIKYLRGGLP